MDSTVSRSLVRLVCAQLCEELKVKIADATAEISKRSRGVERDWAGQLQTRAIRGVGRSTIGDQCRCWGG